MAGYSTAMQYQFRACSSEFAYFDRFIKRDIDIFTTVFEFLVACFLIFIVPGNRSARRFHKSDFDAHRYALIILPAKPLPPRRLEKH